jgi:hypothetical protein
MEYKELRVRIPMELYKRYKHVCVEKCLSMPKQSTFLIRNFVEIQESNDQRLRIRSANVDQT